MPLIDKDGNIRVSVGALVRTVMRRGSIAAASYGAAEYQTGTAVHKRIEKRESEKYDGYFPEVFLSAGLCCQEVPVKVFGRADGVFHDGACYVVDEIKSVRYPLELIDDDYSRLHLSQAMCYAHMLCRKKKQEKIKIRLLYFHIERQEERVIEKIYSRLQLEELFKRLVCSYSRLMMVGIRHLQERNRSLEDLKFPYPTPRDGQRAMVKEVYASLLSGNRLYLDAPTGIGKTIATLFPALKTLVKGYDKVFYLTAKNSVNKIVQNAAELLRAKGCAVKSLSLTAKNKICFRQGECEPEQCPYAAGHYDRINEALYDALSRENAFPRETVVLYAKKHRVCPFEFSLDLSEYCDLVICDYNYIFDPRAELKRYAGSSEKYVLLVDEAHNLVERSREMYSACLHGGDVARLMEFFREPEDPVFPLLQALSRLHTRIWQMCEEEGAFLLSEPPVELYWKLCEVFESLQKMVKSNSFRERFRERELPCEEFMRIFFEFRHFINVYTIYNKSYCCYVDLTHRLWLYCVDPHEILANITASWGNAVFFSATLQPEDYYMLMLGAEDRDIFASIPSPFLRDNFLVLIAPVNTRYQERENTLGEVAGIVHAAVSAKTGNYLVFLPSYEYMERLAVQYSSAYPAERIEVQKQGMTEGERDAFLEKFKERPDKTMTVFAVMGGPFSEGVDLVGSRLSGAVVVSVCLPQPSERREMIRGYFNGQDMEGDKFAYLYPGLNKVFQAGGRVIRGHEDRGFLLLIDDRFQSEEYRELFPAHWENQKAVSGHSEVLKTLTDFWGK